MEKYIDIPVAINVVVNEEDKLMNTNANSNVTINDVEKEVVTMKNNKKKDFTLGGKVNATTWQEFRAVAKEMGISTGTKKYDVLAKEMEEIIMKKNNEKTEVVEVGDLSVTSDIIYVGDNTIIDKTADTKVEVKEVRKLSPMEKTKMMMQLIGNHAIKNREKGFGTTISSYMVCAYILEVEYGIKNLKNWMNKHIVTDEMKQTVINVRKWLVNNNYIKTATFKDEKYAFYIPEQYDGKVDGKKMYDATKFQHGAKTEVTSYRVTKEMNKWF